MKIWKHTSISVFFLSYMVRKAFSYCFENITRDLSISIMMDIYLFIRIYQFLENHNTIYEKTRINLNKNLSRGSARTNQLQIHVGLECLNFKSREEINFDWDPYNKVKICFFDNAEAESKNFYKPFIPNKMKKIKQLKRNKRLVHYYSKLWKVNNYT